MARVQFLRGDAYVAGDLIIQIHVDGTKAGSLIGKRPLELHLAPGTYTVQARMFGIKGETVVLQVGEEDQRVAVSGTRARMFNSAWATGAYIVTVAAPNKPLWLYVVASVALVSLGLFERYRWQKMRPQLLRLSVSEGLTSGSRASSKPLSSPR